MSSISVLFIGGTGKISSACVRHCLERGDEVAVLNRQQTATRPLPNEVRPYHADIEDGAAVREALGAAHFDCVVDVTIREPRRVPGAIDLFADRADQFIFISSASAYQEPVARLPIVESTPLVNPFWEYSRNKIACEELFMTAHRQDGFPVTIVRPSHTYDRTGVPFDGGWTVIERLRANKPVVVHGDGSSLWVLTHHDDFARAFVHLVANPRTIGDSFHITSHEVLTWDAINRTFAAAAGVADPHLVHVPSEVIATALPWGPQLLGDKTHSVIFDNSKIRALAPNWQAMVPLAQGAREVVEWFDADPARRSFDPVVDKAFDDLIARFGI